MRLAWLVASLVLAGCTAPVTNTSPPTLPVGVTLAPHCGVFPDGTEVPCTTSSWTKAVARPPPLQEGWKCYATWTDGPLHVELWSNFDGRLGFYWKWERWKPDGLAWQRMAVYLDATRGGVLNVAYQPSGFAAFDRALAQEGRVFAYLHLHQYRAWIEQDGAWRVAPEITFNVNSWGPQFWVTAAAAMPNQTYHVDVMQPTRDNDDPYRWSLRPFDETLDGTPVLFGHMNRGAKYANLDYANVVRTPTNCGRAPS